jgi:hypothetical protein
MTSLSALARLATSAETNGSTGRTFGSLLTRQRNGLLAWAETRGYTGGTPFGSMLNQCVQLAEWIASDLGSYQSNSTSLANRLADAYKAIELTGEVVASAYNRAATYVEGGGEPTTYPFTLPVTLT